MKDKWVSVFKEMFKSRDTQLVIQAHEYERRLKALNGESEKLIRMQNDYISREAFDRTMEARSERFDRSIELLKTTSEERYKGILSTLKDLTDYKIQQQGSLRIILWLVGIGVSLIIGIAIKLIAG